MHILENMVTHNTHAATFYNYNTTMVTGMQTTAALLKLCSMVTIK